MKQNTLLITLAVIGLTLLVGCGVAPEQSNVAEAVEVAKVTTFAVKTEPLLITSVEKAPGAWQASLAQGQPVIGRYEVQPLPNGQAALKLESDPCHLSTLIVSAGEVPTILQTLMVQGRSIAGFYETQLLPNGEMAIKLKKADAAGALAC